MNQAYNNYLGKKDEAGRYHLLPYHCLDAAAVGTVFVKSDLRLFSIFNNHPLFRENKGLLPFLISVHDLGKFSKPFQDKICNDSKNEAGHTEETFTFLRYELRNKDGILNKYISGKCSDAKKIRKINSNLEVLFEAVSGHHGKPVVKDSLNPDKALDDFGKKNKDDARVFISKMLSLFLPEIIFPDCSLEDTKSVSWVLAGLCVVSDWIASNNSYFTWVADDIPLDEYWQRAVSCAEGVLPKTGLIPSPVSDSDNTKKLFGFEPRPLQKVVESLEISNGANLYIIEESTGGGKTEASILLAEKLMKTGCGNGFYFALPTMATANAMYERIAGDSKLYEKLYCGNLPVSVVLAHGQTILSDRYQDFLGRYGRGSSDYWMYDTNKKALLSSIGVGTVDQVLMGVLPWRHQCLRLLGSVRNILIIDEVHAYDSYMNGLLKKLLKYLKSCGCSVILLSATLPKILKTELLSAYSNSFVLPEESLYPLITHVDSEGVMKEISVPPSPDKYVSVRLVYDKDSAVNELIEKAKSGGCVCWIRNTVSDAVEGYNRLKSMTDLPIHLFHARFAMGDRLNRENEILGLFGKSSTSELRRGQILVATQVVEQSLDLDFDFMISDLAPVDLIIQRAGRLWRHNRIRPSGFDIPDFVIFSPNPNGDITDEWYSSVFKGGSYVYPEHGRLWKTASILLEMGGFSMPKDARYLIDSVYSEDDNDVPEVLRKHNFEAKQKDKISDAHAGSISLNLSHGYTNEIVWSSDEPALTREGEKTVSVELWKSGSCGDVLWFDKSNHSELLSRVSVNARKISAPVLSEYYRKDSDEPIRVVFKNDGNVWRPVDSVFMDRDVYYSLDEGLVFRI